MSEEEFKVGDRVRLRTRPELEGVVSSIHIGGGGRPNGVLLYDVDGLGTRRIGGEIEHCPATPDDALVDALAEDLADTVQMGNIDGYGDEGAGYDWRTIARDLLNGWLISPRREVEQELPRDTLKALISYHEGQIARLKPLLAPRAHENASIPYAGAGPEYLINTDTIPPRPTSTVTGKVVNLRKEALPHEWSIIIERPGYIGLFYTDPAAGLRLEPEWLGKQVHLTLDAQAHVVALMVASS